MKAVLVFSCLMAVATAQFVRSSAGPRSSAQPLKEATHLQAITEPHLPQDPNVLVATAQFLNQFSELKALADAAPDPIPSQRPSFAPARPSFTPARPSFTPALAAAPHRFSAAVPSPQPAPRPAQHFRGIPQPVRSNFDVHGQISSLLSSSHAVNPSTAPRQQFSSFAPQQRAAPPTTPRPFDPNVPITNQHGHIINPLQYPGPLADEFPAAVGGEIRSIKFTPEVEAAQKALAQAHATILKQQAESARLNPQPTQQQRFF